MQHILVVDTIFFSMLRDKIHFELIFEVINYFGENFGNGSCKMRIFILEWPSDIKWGVTNVNKKNEARIMG